MYTCKANPNYNPKGTQALVYKGYVILLEKYDSCWSWSSDFSQGCSCTRKDALESAQLNIEQILMKKNAKLRNSQVEQLKP